MSYTTLDITTACGVTTVGVIATPYLASLLARMRNPVTGCAAAVADTMDARRVAVLLLPSPTPPPPPPPLPSLPGATTISVGNSPVPLLV